MIYCEDKHADVRMQCKLDVDVIISCVESGISQRHGTNDIHAWLRDQFVGI